MGSVVLKSGRLTLRPFSWGDIKDIYDLCSREETSRYSLWDPHKSYLDTVKYIFFVKWRSAGIHWAVTESSTGKMLGSCSFVKIDEDTAEGELGYSIHPDHWGRGLGAETVRTLMYYGFKKLDLGKIYVRVMTENIRSVALAERVGMKRVESDEKYVMDGDIRREVIRLEITAEEYRKTYGKK